MAPTDWKEDIAPDEAAAFDRYAEQIATLQKSNARDGVMRGLHAKQNLGVEAELVIADVPAEARHGMFATPGTYRALVRFSNGAPRRQADKVLDVRGIAIKVFGVAGTKIIPGMEDATTQDFLAIRTRTLPIKNAHEFMTLMRVAKPPSLLPLRLMGALGLRRGVSILKSALGGLKMPQASLAGTSYFSALPIMLGSSAVQFSFAAREPATPVPLTERDALGAELSERLRKTQVTYDLQLRFYVDAQQTPIEDATVDWRSPWLTVGQLTLPVQDTASERGTRVNAYVDQLSFDPWHARADMRPLGNIMRARNVAYRASTQARKAAAEPREAPTF
jgi:hypothetical protein